MRLMAGPSSRVTKIEQCCPVGTRFAHGARELYVLEPVHAVVKNADMNGTSQFCCVPPKADYRLRVSSSLSLARKHIQIARRGRRKMRQRRLALHDDAG